MPLRTRIAVNPFLFLLAKEIVKFEIAWLFEETSESNTKKYLTLRRPINLLTPVSYYFADINDIFPKGPGTFLKDLYYDNKRDEYSENLLNRLVKSISILGSFSSWAQFINVCDDFEWTSKYQDMLLTDLTNDEMLELRSDVQAALNYLHSLAKLNGVFLGTNYRNVLYNDKRYILRAMERNEIGKFEGFLETVNDDVKIVSRQELFDKNPNMFFLVQNEFNRIVGTASILPLKNETFEEIKSGQRKESEIGYFDIAAKSRSILLSELFYEDNDVSHILSHLILFMAYKAAEDNDSFKVMSLHRNGVEHLSKYGFDLTELNGVKHYYATKKDLDDYYTFKDEE